MKRTISILMLLIALAAGRSLGPSSEARAAEPAAGAAARPANPPSPTAIPLAEIAPAAVEISKYLRTLDALSEPGREITRIQESLPEVTGQIDHEMEGIVEIRRDSPRILSLETQELRWQRRQARLSGWLTVLTNGAESLQAAIDRLAGLGVIWSKTRDEVLHSEGASTELGQVEETLKAIESSRNSAERQRAALLVLQARVAHEQARCNDALATIARAEQSAVGSLLTRESPPVWDRELWLEVSKVGSDRLGRIVGTYGADVKEYLGDPEAGLPVHLALYAALCILLCAARRQVRKWGVDGMEILPRMQVFDRPYAAALAGTLLIATSVASPVPTELKNVLRIVGVAAVLRVALPLLPRRFRRMLYFLAVLFSIDVVRQVLVGIPLVEQVIFVVESLATALFLGWLLTSKGFAYGADANRFAQGSLVRYVAGIALGLVTAGLMADLMGYLRLARLLTPGLIAVSGVALGLYACYLIAAGAVSVAMRVPPVRHLRMVEHHRDLLESRLCRALAFAAVLGWLARTLEYLGILKPLLARAQSLLGAKLELGTIHLSVEEVCAFLVAILAAFFLSRFVRFALEEDIHSRTNMAPGLSYAISTLLHYVLLTLGFVVGLALLGIDLTGVTVMLSAFGVGIGFGLQSVVNNFASGLILLIERPVHAGDTVDLGGLAGKVRHIGIRATTIRTFDGADTVVPNSMLVSEKVVNWTLSDRLRRIRLPVGINYETCPDHVIQLLVSVAIAHPHVLQQPPPQALLVSYGDSAINYELQAWTDRFELWSRTQSDLAIAIYAAVQKAGMEFPYPQREIRLLNDNGFGGRHPDKRGSDIS